MKFIERLWVALKPSEARRMKYIYNHHIFKGIGENVIFVPRLLPVEPEYIKIGNNVVVAARVTFITHDASHFVFNNIYKDRIPYYHGCIEIGDNVFIGSNSTILPDVRICNNVFIAAGAVVAKDITSEGVWGGVPARRLKSFEELYQNRLMSKTDAECNVENCWKNFYEKRKML